MPTLTDAQKRQIIAQEPRRGAQYIFNAIQMNDNLSLDDFPNMRPDKRRVIQGLIDSLPKLPNSQEQSDWDAIATFKSRVAGAYPSDWGMNDLENMSQMVERYIRSWDSLRPQANHVDDAIRINDDIQAELQQRREQQERDDWNNLSRSDLYSLRAYLSKYPNSIHKNEINNLIIQLSDFQTSWDKLDKNDIFAVKDFITSNSGSPFVDVAKNYLDNLRQSEVSEMRNYPNNYEVSRFLRLISEGVFTKDELIQAGVATVNVINTLQNPPNGLDINSAISNSTPSCQEGYTDVYFFGIPSTGKTCVLMGLVRSQLIQLNFASNGGDYAAQLRQYAEKGITVPRTPGTFTTTLEAKMYDNNDQNIMYGVNLVEMSGEEFAFKIVNHPDHTIAFEDMGGDGAAQLLRNNNRKVFFLIIDPTASDVYINREVNMGIDPEGMPIIQLENASVNQNILIQKMINLFEAPENREIMRKVDSLHIIVTKADTLGPIDERDEKARDIFNRICGGPVLTSLQNLCRECNINTNTNLSPKLYTFSLGSFYVGGLFEYNDTDANKLIHAIMNSTQRIRVEGFWDRVRRAVN